MATSMRSISGGGLSMLSETENGSEISEFPEEDYGDEISDDESLLEDGSLSPNTYAEHDARLRAKDEKRLQLDLSKHQELLLDSQRLNQSIIRCLGWTEDLIKEGQKALNYHVRVSDVEVGGRVLTPDEVDAGISHRRGLLSPAHEPGNPMGEDLHLETAALVNELLPTEGPETEPLEKDPLQPVHIEESKDDGANSVEPPQTPGPRGSGGAVLGLGLGTYLHGLSETLGI